MEKVSAAMASLVHELEACAQWYSALLEWKRLHDLLQELEGHVSLIGERVRGRPLDIQPHLREIESVWRLCGDIVSNKLVPFAKEIEHIGKQYEEREGQRSGEEWIVKILQDQEDISQDLEELRLVPLQDHIGNLDSLITKHLFRADVKLQATKIALSDSCNKLSMIIVDEFLEEDLVGELMQFVQLQKRLIEWIGLHELYQKLRTNYITIYKLVKRKQPEELDAGVIELIRIQWQVFKNTVLWELVTFAKDISYIGEAYQEQEQALCGEEWVVKLVRLEKAIDQALRDHSLIPLHESVSKLGGLIGGYFIQVDKKLQKCVNDLNTDSNTLSTRLRGRIGP